MAIAHSRSLRAALVLLSVAGRAAALAAEGSPIIDALSAPSASVLTGSESALSVTARDPAGRPLAYAWTASAGTIVGAGANATWTAPASAGWAQITVTATNDAGQAASAAASIYSTIALYEGGLSAPLSAPRRIAVADSGELYAVNGRDPSLFLLTANGGLKGAVSLPGVPLSIATSSRGLYASLRDGRLLLLDPARGRVLGSIASGAAAGAVGMAWDEANGLLWIAERHANRVRALRADGSVAVTLAQAGTTVLKEPVDVALDPAAGLVWVALETNESGKLVHAFRPDGTYVSSIIGFGGGPGQVTRAAGLAVDRAGRVYVADAFQGVVQVVSRAGLALGTVGTFGRGPGQLFQPADVELLASGDLLVANQDAGTLQRYGSGAPLPTCAGDSDCDGLPDDWELAHGLSPFWAGDALADPDGDGLDNLHELAYGTDPRNADSDGDGFADGEEVLAGTDPLSREVPLLAARAPASSPPGLVQLSSSLVTRLPACTYRWRQVQGPAARLLDGASGAPRFIARTPGVYAFEGVASCAGVASSPAGVSVEILNVPPRPDPTRLVVTRAGEPFVLDGSLTSDANGDAFWLRWDQTIGAPLVAPSGGPELVATADVPGYYAFALTATDTRGAAATEEGGVYAVGKAMAPSALVSSPLMASVGELVTLDATRSESRNGKPRYAWTQESGPPVALSDAAAGAPTFVPPEPGLYAFTVHVRDNKITAPPARVEVYVGPAEGLPMAFAEVSAPAVDAGAPVRLDGARSRAAAGGRLTHAWRQVSGPEAGLTDADRPVATVVPFAPGHYVFELVVREGASVGVPVQVELDADAPGVARPRAVATAPATALEGDTVSLDGSASTGNGPLVYRWTQVAGPWMPLLDPGSPRPAFEPAAPGTYGFELQVEDGGVRSAPARVSVIVFGKKASR
ncbi:PKD domain-containing protein [Anaeromyxobacter terrae]|uniref:PKD domain-containing protein n=1 Tax=Anaeromyxobacter terrae TaxID=2925406 RepID=UPI001F5ADDE8|nr:hypothetical protein [Anaeromyxobacter sp. SG22]